MSRITLTTTTVFLLDKYPGLLTGWHLTSAKSAQIKGHILCRSHYKDLYEFIIFSLMPLSVCNKCLNPAILKCSNISAFRHFYFIPSKILILPEALSMAFETFVVQEQSTIKIPKIQAKAVQFHHTSTPLLLLLMTSPSCNMHPWSYVVCSYEVTCLLGLPTTSALSMLSTLHAPETSQLSQEWMPFQGIMKSTLSTMLKQMPFHREEHGSWKSSRKTGMDGSQRSHFERTLPLIGVQYIHFGADEVRISSNLRWP